MNSEPRDPVISIRKPSSSGVSSPERMSRTVCSAAGLISMTGRSTANGLTARSAARSDSGTAVSVSADTGAPQVSGHGEGPDSRVATAP